MGRSHEESLMLKAAAHGDVEVVRRLIGKFGRSMLKAHTSDGSTPVLLAARRGHSEVVRHLIDCGATWQDTDYDNRRKGNVLHYACWGGAKDLVLWLLETYDPDLGCTDVVGNTPLLYSVYGGHREVVELLLARGRSLHEHNQKHHTAVLQAACGGHLELLRWLLDVRNFSIDERDHDGNTALLFAAWGGHRHVIDFLLERGAALHERNFNGHCIFLSAANGGRTEIVEWLLSEHNFNLHAVNHNGDTALLLACYGGHLPLVKRLLKLGANIGDRNSCGFTPLLSAANGAQLKTVKWLVAKGCSVHERDNDGYTGLILAACGGSIELVKYFLAQGASLAEKNNNGDTPLLLAAYCGHTRLVEWLLDHGSKAAERNNTHMGVTISAANGGHLPTVCYLVKKLGPVAHAETDVGGYTPFLLAAQRGHLGVVQYLASRGSDVNARTHRGHDALALAVEFPVVRQYVTYISARNPLEIACDLRDIDFVHQLIRSGVDVRREAPAALSLASVVGKYPGASIVDHQLVRLLKLSIMPWSPATHHLHGKDMRRQVLVMLWLKKQLDACHHLPYLPAEVWLHVMSFVQPVWFSPTARATDAKRMGFLAPMPWEARLRRQWRRQFLQSNQGCQRLRCLLHESSSASSSSSMQTNDEGDEVEGVGMVMGDPSSMVARPVVVAQAAATEEQQTQRALSAMPGKKARRGSGSASGSRDGSMMPRAQHKQRQEQEEDGAGAQHDAMMAISTSSDAAATITTSSSRRRKSGARRRRGSSKSMLVKISEGGSRMMLGNLVTYSTTSLVGDHHADVEGPINEAQTGRITPPPASEVPQGGQGAAAGADGAHALLGSQAISAPAPITGGVRGRERTRSVHDDDDDDEEEDDDDVGDDGGNDEPQQQQQQQHTSDPDACRDTAQFAEFFSFDGEALHLSVPHGASDAGKAAAAARGGAAVGTVPGDDGAWCCDAVSSRVQFDGAECEAALSWQLAHQHLAHPARTSADAGTGAQIGEHTQQPDMGPGVEGHIASRHRRGVHATSSSSALCSSLACSASAASPRMKKAKVGPRAVSAGALSMQQQQQQQQQQQHQHPLQRLLQTGASSSSSSVAAGMFSPSAPSSSATTPSLAPFQPWAMLAAPMTSTMANGMDASPLSPTCGSVPSSLLTSPMSGSANREGPRGFPGLASTAATTTTTTITTATSSTATTSATSNGSGGSMLSLAKASAMAHVTANGSPSSSPTAARKSTRRRLPVPPASTTATPTSSLDQQQQQQQQQQQYGQDQVLMLPPSAHHSTVFFPSDLEHEQPPQQQSGERVMESQNGASQHHQHYHHHHHQQQQQHIATTVITNAARISWV